MILLSLTGLVRTVLIILGVLLLLQVVGKMAQARRNVDAERRMKAEEEAARKMKEEAERNYGKTSITSSNTKGLSDSDFADFEEIE